tara:strand:- start:2919 stop:4760 length:1842 start_codon:yes stop_codon:yes gene_type:complete
MKKTVFSTFLFILFLLFAAISYLSFFGHETDRFNKIIKSEVKKFDNNIDLDFEKISILLDIKKLVLFVKFINPNLNYSQISIPLKSLRTDVDLEFLTQKKLVIKKIILATKYIDFNKIKSLLNKTDLKEENFKNIKSARLQIKDLKLEFDENFKLKDNYSVSGDINTVDIKISDEYEISNLITNFLYEKKSLYLNEISWNFNDSKNTEREFFNGELNLKQTYTGNYDVDLRFKAKNVSSLPKIAIMNYSFGKGSVSEVKTKFSINKNKSIFFKNLKIENRDNEFKVKDLHLDKDYNLINFKEIHVKTSIDNNINNEFKIINKDKISIKGKVFDAKMLIKELSKDSKKNKFFKGISKDIKIDFNRILKGAKFPIKNFSLVGKINKGEFEKILAKSDLSDSKYLDISLKKQKKTDSKILEVYSDIAVLLLNDYKFFQGLEGGNLIYVSKFNKKNSSNVLTINNFKLNKAPTLAKLLTLADLKGLTDTLKGDGIAFDTLAIKYESNPAKMDIKEIFMIGPSISILIEGYVEKKSGLISLRGTLVPAKTLNTIISKIPLVGNILVGSKVGEGVFGISFKIKGLPNDLKTTVNPVKTLTPRFITRALEAVKKKGTKQQ